MDRIASQPRVFSSIRVLDPLVSLLSFPECKKSLADNEMIKKYAAENQNKFNHPLFKTRSTKFKIESTSTRNCVVTFAQQEFGESLDSSSLHPSYYNDMMGLAKKFYDGFAGNSWS